MADTSPMTPVLENIPELALDWHRAGRGVAVATVVETWGSAPRGVGAQLVIADDGEMQGSVSGGCVEGAVVLEAQEAVVDGKPRLLEFGVADDDAFAVGLACGGTIRILIEPVGSTIPEGMLSDLVAARAARQSLAYVTSLTQGGPRLEEPEGRMTGVQEDGDTFVALHQPPLRMVIIGAVHIAQHLVPMAQSCGHDPIVIDPRGAFASAARFPAHVLREDWPDEVIAELGLDSRTSVITLAHDPKLDDPAVIAALNSDVYYLGCLGSRRTHGKRLERLSAAGIDAASMDRIDGPVGLSIGAKGPAEIAVSIMAGVIAALRGL